MLLTKDAILFVLKNLNKNKYEINKIGLFGSFSKGTQTEKSDIDIYIDFKEEADIFINFFDVKYDLEDIFHKKVDIVTSGNLNGEYKVKRVKEYKEMVKKEILESVIYV